MSAPRTRSIAGRVALAIALFAGFYAIGAAMVLGLLWVPWAQLRYEDRVEVSGLVCGGLALYLAFALLPRLGATKPKEPPAPTTAHARLRALIAETARAVGEPAPDELYVLATANAWAARRPGFLGLGGPRMIGIGLPLLSALDEDELRAVVAHELGHHHAGDLHLGPWVHRTRMAVGTTLARLDGASFLLHLPFALYARLFLRVTQQVSREQELAADAIAGRVAGREATARALLGTERLAPRWSAYFFGEVVPLIDAGQQPPLLEGFRRFLAEPSLRADVVESIARMEAREPKDSDTHPALADRLAALASPRVTRPPSARTALTLLDSVERAEKDALSLLLVGPRELRPIDWDGVGERWLAMWRARMRAEPRIAQVALSEIPSALERWESYDAPAQGVSLLSPAAKRRKVADLLGIRLAVGLADLGFRIEAPPGAETRAILGELELEPESLVRKLAAGTLSASELRRRVAEAEAHAELAARGG